MNDTKPRARKLSKKARSHRRNGPFVWNDGEPSFLVVVRGGRVVFKTKSNTCAACAGFVRDACTRVHPGKASDYIEAPSVIRRHGPRPAVSAAQAKAVRRS